MLRIVSTTAILVGLAAFDLISGAAPLSAQSLRNAQEPAEFPPSSFTGRQYVDSNGCVYVRAGFDGAVTWVPRVSRQREVLCGFQPTFAEAPVRSVPTIPDPAPAPTQVATAPATPSPAPAPVRATTPRPTQTVAAPTSARPAPTPTTTPAPTPTRVVQAPTVRTNPPVQTPVQTVRPGGAPPAQVATATSCPGFSGVSARYVSNSSRAVRCGPQGTHPGAYSVPGGGGATGATQVVRVKPPAPIAVPEGYKPAFEDDRLNPNRGQQTRSGFAQMRLVWTAGVPRRLVDQNTGRDVTSLFPGLRFPFISMKQQTTYVERNGWPATANVQPTRRGSMTVSTKNTPATAPVTRTVTAAPAQVAGPAPLSGHRYVQVGTFGGDGNAQNAAGRLQQMGLPARIGTYQKAGKTYRVVMAGPFNSGAALNNALSAARRAGFSDAYTRK